MSNTFNPTNNYKDYFFSDNTGVSVPILSFVFVPVVTLFLAFSIMPKQKEESILESVQESVQNIIPNQQTGGSKTKTKSKKYKQKHRKTKRH